MVLWDEHPTMVQLVLSSENKDVVAGRLHPFEEVKCPPDRFPAWDMGAQDFGTNVSAGLHSRDLSLQHHVALSIKFHQAGIRECFLDPSVVRESKLTRCITNLTGQWVAEERYCSNHGVQGVGAGYQTDLRPKSIDTVRLFPACSMEDLILEGTHPVLPDVTSQL